MNNNSVSVIYEQMVLGKDFKVYGTEENPLFLAKDVANWIDYAKTGKGTYDVSKMLKTVDEEEKVKNIVRTPGGNQNTWFLTEDGIYEVLMQSRKPIAKSFKKEVKAILKQIRKTGGYIPVTEQDDEVTIMSKALQIMQKTLMTKDDLIAQKDNKIIDLKLKVS